jgi:RNA polymerase sigma factor (sigma-70 family)
VSRGSTGVAEATRIAEPVSDDHRLVAAVRRGDDRAFEALYSSYQRRIHAYVLGMVKDHGRAEDVTQEVFVSALRRMRETERPIAFKPWIYEIAKNACIDQFRRSRRTEEVSLQADGDGLAPADYGRLVGPDPAPDDAVAAKQELDHLCGAFGGLSDTHHEILLLRELEGLSYREIGEQLGMSRAAVESTLFRARRRLTEEYDELASGARCRRIQGLIATAAGDTRLGVRESRRLSRHLSHCQPCRREAMAAGLDAAILAPVPLRRRVAEKLGALLPFGWFSRAAQTPMLSDQLSGGWGKAAAAAAVLIAGAGAAGVGTHVVGGDRPARADRSAPHRAAPARATAVRSAAVAKPKAARTGQQAGKPAKQTGKPRRSRRGGAPERAGTRVASAPTTASGAGAGANAAGTSGGTDSGLPNVTLPASTNDPAAPVEKTAENVTNTVKPVTNTVQNAGDSVQPVVNQATDTVQGATQPVTDAAGGATQTVEDTTGVPVPDLP